MAGALTRPWQRYTRRNPSGSAPSSPASSGASGSYAGGPPSRTRLRKSIRGDKRARHFGTYGLYDKKDVMVIGSPETGYGLGLDDVEAALTEERRR